MYVMCASDNIMYVDHASTCVRVVMLPWDYGLVNSSSMLIIQNKLGFMFMSCPNSISTHVLTMGDPRTFLV
jgi:hypothetical protein